MYSDLPQLLKGEHLSAQGSPQRGPKFLHPQYPTVGYTMGRNGPTDTRNWTPQNIFLISLWNFKYSASLSFYTCMQSRFPPIPTAPFVYIKKDVIWTTQAQHHGSNLIHAVVEAKISFDIKVLRGNFVHSLGWVNFGHPNTFWTALSLSLIHISEPTRPP